MYVASVSADLDELARLDFTSVLKLWPVPTRYTETTWFTFKVNQTKDLASHDFN
jgi:hypothetical protein